MPPRPPHPAPRFVTSRVAPLLEQDPDIKPVICVGKKQKNCRKGAGQVFADLPGGLNCRTALHQCLLAKVGKSEAVIFGLIVRRRSTATIE
jgi:hypothetical protein